MEKIRAEIVKVWGELVEQCETIGKESGNETTRQQAAAMCEILKKCQKQAQTVPVEALKSGEEKTKQARARIGKMWEEFRAKMRKS